MHVKNHKGSARLLLVLLLLCHGTLSQTLYKVILNSPMTDAAVVIDNQTFALFPSEESSIILQANAPSGRPYRYARLKKGTTEIIDQEPFLRVPENRESTYNEFYNRNWNFKEVVRFNVLDEFTPQYNRAPDDQLHPPNEIVTLHVTAEQSQIDYVHDNFLDEAEILANVTHISANSIKHFANCEFSVSGRTSIYFNKLPYKIKLPNTGPSLNGFRHFRLRTTDSDPSYMRDYLTTEVLRATNQPGTRASFVRLFLNARAIGLFIFIEKYDDTWLEREFNPNKAESYANGILYEGNGGESEYERSDLSYKTEGLEAYNMSGYTIEESPKDEEGTFVDLMHLTRFIRDQRGLQRTAYDARTTLMFSDWEKHIDVEGVLANIAIEFLIGSADGYTQNTNNYYLYKDPIRNKFIYIAWDFDYNFGNGAFSMEELVTGDYRRFGRITELPLTSTLLGIPKYRIMFEKQIKTIATKLLNPTFSFPVIDSVANLIREDVNWDHTLPRIRFGPNYVSGGLLAFVQGKMESTLTIPFSFNLIYGVDFIIRVNQIVNFDSTVEGHTGHISLLGLKEFIRIKLANYYAQPLYEASRFGALPSLK